MRKVADNLWTKQVAEPTTPAIPPVVLLSGKTNGGGEPTEAQRLKERYPTMNIS